MAKSNSSSQSRVTALSASGTPPSPELPWSESQQSDLLWRVIQRYDGYINAANTKAAITLTFNSFLFATVVLKWVEVSQNFGNNKIAVGIAAILMLVCAVASIFSLWFGLNAIVPVLNSPKEPKKYHSLVFFCHVAEFSSPEAYVDAIRTGTAAATVDDLAKQAHALSKIVTRKFSLLTWATRLIVFVQLPAFFLMILTMVIVAFLKSIAGGQP